MPSDEMIEVYCDECEGSGWVESALFERAWPCRHCNGKGRVFEPLTPAETIDDLDERTGSDAK